MAEEQPESVGIFASLRRLFETFVSLAQNRVEVLLLDFEESKWRLIQAFIWAAAVAALGLMALVTATITIIVVVGEKGRILMLLLLCLAYGGGAFLAYRALCRRLRAWTPLAGTRAELRKDRECLSSARSRK